MNKYINKTRKLLSSLSSPEVVFFFHFKQQKGSKSLTLNGNRIQKKTALRWNDHDTLGFQAH